MFLRCSDGRNWGGRIRRRLSFEPDHGSNRACVGPWSEQRAVYEFPEMSKNNPRRDRDTFCYAVKEHIEFAEANRMLVTYACNSFKLEKLFANTDIYRPQTVLVHLPSQKG